MKKILLAIFLVGVLLVTSFGLVMAKTGNVNVEDFDTLTLINSEYQGDGSFLADLLDPIDEGDECPEGDGCDDEWEECDDPEDGDECEDPEDGEECEDPENGDECDDPEDGDECDDPEDGDECDDPENGDECDDPENGEECEDQDNGEDDDNGDPKDENAYCSEDNGKIHPAVSKLAEIYGKETDQELMMDFFCDGHGIGQIYLALHTEKLMSNIDDSDESNGISFGDVLELRTEMGWGKIWQKYAADNEGFQKTPPGQDKKDNQGEDLTSTSQDDDKGKDKTPPGQNKENYNDKTPPGQDKNNNNDKDKGPKDNFQPKGLDKDKKPKKDK